MQGGFSECLDLWSQYVGTHLVTVMSRYQLHMYLLMCAAYLVVADEAYGRQIPFAFLERVRDEFEDKFAAIGRTAPANSMDKTFGCVWRGRLRDAVCRSPLTDAHTLYQPHA